MTKLLVVVDYQNDFVDGTLGFAGAEKLEPGIAAAVKTTLDEGGFVLFTRDTHEEEYLCTREGQYLPVAHCVKGTGGHRLYGSLRRYEETPVPHTLLLDKPTFGSADIGRCATELCGRAPDVVEMCGLVTDICVVSNAILLHTFLPKAHIRILSSLCGTNNPTGGQNALDVLRGLGMEIAL